MALEEEVKKAFQGKGLIEAISVYRKITGEYSIAECKRQTEKIVEKVSKVELFPCCKIRTELLKQVPDEFIYCPFCGKGLYRRKVPK